MKSYVELDAKKPENGIFNTDNAVKGPKLFQLKRFFRLVYPPQARPKILNIDCDVIDISSKGIRFAYNRRSYSCPESLRINEPVNLKIQFDDGEIVDVQVKILRCFEDLQLGKTCFAGSIIRGMSQHRINKEQASIRNLPDFYKQQTASPS
ncbi:MAG: hypothetical protein GWO86_00665 [Planctomycetes bacterium]|nr:hypothetical protein [Planctomycetota bacterium]